MDKFLSVETDISFFLWLFLILFFNTLVQLPSRLFFQLETILWE